MKLSVIVVSFNTRDLTLACLGSVFEQTRDLPMEVIVVDNASTDGSARGIAERFPRARLIESERNLGFAAGNNLAAERARGDYLLLLNPDTVVLDRAIERLVEFAESRPDAMIWGGRTVFADGSLNPASCWRAPSLWSVFCMATGLTSLRRRSNLFARESYGSWKRDTERSVDIVSGCFFLIRRDLWRRLGGFDPAFFMYGEEADLCLRAARVGAKPMITPDATIVHLGGASERARADKLVRLLTAKVLLLRRHWPPVRARLGVMLLAVWPLTRSIVLRVASVGFGSRCRGAASMWAQVWRRRDEWLRESSNERSAVDPKPVGQAT